MTARVGLVGLAILATLAAGCTSKAKPTTAPSVTPTVSTTPTTAPVTYQTPPPTLPALRVQLSTAPAPWLPPAVVDGGINSAKYVKAAGFTYAPEMLAVHYHAHLDITVDGKKVTVPPYIGFVAKGQNALGLAPLHTHYPDGIVHIENSVPATFVLGQFFIEWGVRLSRSCLGGYCADKSHDLAFFVDGRRYGGDPTSLVLRQHQEIAIEYGKRGGLPKPPASYRFPAGY